MSKHDALTEEEFDAFVPNQNITRNMEAFARQFGKPRGEMKVLDWGCGRGRHVLWLREQGYQAYGVELDPMPVQNGLALVKAKGYPDDSLSLIDNKGRTPFPDGFFDYVFSGNVLEHVADIDAVCVEMSRITRKGGGGYHVFPAQRQPIEGHLFMPFVHWLPPGWFRKWIIRTCVRLGREPRWVEVREASVDVKTEFYYKYTLNNIFYRKYASVQRAFESHGLAVAFTTLDHPKIKRHPIFSRLLKARFLKSFLNHILLTYKLVELQVEKR
ncbi:MAG: class I SAM-dependent methyltransferase [Anaerolineales bacterium]|nr:class I SAM-dependent methyltransferase [Anaerolineales bacterium]